MAEMREKAVSSSEQNMGSCTPNQVFAYCSISEK